jgi:hypothetical protein
MSTIAFAPVGAGDRNAAQASVPDNGALTTSFADLLDGDTKKQKAQQTEAPHRAYSFAELGMFGLHQLILPADAKTGTAAVADAAAKSAATAHAAVKPAAARTAAATTAPAPLVYVPFMQSETPQASAVVRVSAAGSASSASVAAIAPRASVTVAAPKPQRAAAPGTAGSPDADTKQIAPKTPDPVSVTVSGPDEALEIAVRSGGEPATEVTKLRRLIETTVASFEMDVARLHINGAAIENVFSLGGGANGGSAR